MRLQSTIAACGPSALRNALLALGVTRSEAECEALCKVTAAEGTSHRKLLAAVAAVAECRPAVIEETHARHALLVLDGVLRAGRPAILIVDAWEHWVSVIGTLGSRYLVADSADSELVLSLDITTLRDRWGCPGARRPYWGVAL